MAIPNLFKKKAGLDPDPVKLGGGEKPVPLIPKDQMHPVGSHIGSHVGAPQGDPLLGVDLGHSDHLIVSVNLKDNGDAAHPDGLGHDSYEASEADPDDVFEDYQGPDKDDPVVEKLESFSNEVAAYIASYAGKLSPDMIAQKVMIKFGLSESVAMEEAHFALAEYKQGQVLSAIEQAMLEQAKLVVPLPITVPMKDVDPDELLEMLGQQMKKQMNKDQT